MAWIISDNEFEAVGVNQYSNQSVSVTVYSQFAALIIMPILPNWSKLFIVSEEVHQSAEKRYQQNQFIPWLFLNH